MAQKTTEKHFCNDCESEFKIVFELENTSGYPKFCPFCNSELEDEDDEALQNKDEF